MGVVFDKLLGEPLLHSHPVSSPSLLIRLNPPTLSGHYDYGGWLTDSNMTVNLVQGLLRHQPFYVAQETTYSAIAIKVGTKSSTVNAVCRLGIYNNNNGAPGNLVVDAGTFNIYTTNGVVELPINVTLKPGLYFTCIVTNGTGATVYAVGSATQGIQMIPPIAIVSAGTTFDGVGMAGCFAKSGQESIAVNGLPSTAIYDTMYNLTNVAAFGLKIA